MRCPVCGRDVEPSRFGFEKANGTRPRRFPPHKRLEISGRPWCPAAGWPVRGEKATKAAVQPQLVRFDG